jgi:hypothetical protein
MTTADWLLLGILLLNILSVCCITWLWETLRRIENRTQGVSGSALFSINQALTRIEVQLGNIHDALEGNE